MESPKQETLNNNSGEIDKDFARILRELDEENETTPDPPDAVTEEEERKHKIEKGIADMVMVGQIARSGGA